MNAEPNTIPYGRKTRANLDLAPDVIAGLKAIQALVLRDMGLTISRNEGVEMAVREFIKAYTNAHTA